MWVRWRVGAVLVVLGAVGACSGSDESELADGRLEVEVVPIGDHALRLEAAVAVDGGPLVALASTTGGLEADVLLRSADGGRTWDRAPGPLTRAAQPPRSAFIDFPTVEGPPTLLAASRWVVMTRDVSLADASAPAIAHEPSRQLAVVSADAGARWTSLELPVPEQTTQVIRAMTIVDDRLVLVGGTRRTDASPVGGFGPDGLPPDAFDAAVWRAVDPGSTEFERVGAEVFDGQDGGQLLRDVRLVEGRVMALGIDWAPPYHASMAAVWESTDDAVSWRPAPGIETLRLENPGVFERFGDPEPGGVKVLIGNDGWRLPAGGSAFVAYDPAEHELHTAGGTASTTGAARSATWNEDSACDCSVALTGIVVEGVLRDERPLPFHDCRDRSLRGYTRVGPPNRVGRSLVAIASCDDDNAQAVSVAWSIDDGGTWDTTRLTTRAEELGYVEIAELEGPTVPAIRLDDGSVVAFGQATEAAGPPVPFAAPVVAVLIGPS